MKKKVFITIIVILLIATFSICCYLVMQKKNNNVKEIETQEEFSNEQMRKTIITLYYQDKETKELVPEGRMIDSKDLLTNPYGNLLNMLIETPKNEKLQSAIPKDTRVLKVELKGDIAYVDLSKEFIDNHKGGEEEENKTIYSIVNTLTELNEINGVKILINGKENQEFKDKKLNFKNTFLRIDDKNNEKLKAKNND